MQSCRARRPRSPSRTRPTGKSTSFIERKTCVVERVEADCDALQPGVAERRAPCAGVRSEPLVVSVRSRSPSIGSDGLSTSRSRSRRMQRLAAREPDLLARPARTKSRASPRDLLEGEQVGAAQEGEVPAEDVLRHAVRAAEVAAVRHGDPQIAQRAGERVLHRHAEENDSGGNKNSTTFRVRPARGVRATASGDNQRGNTATACPAGRWLQRPRRRRSSDRRPAADRAACTRSRSGRSRSAACLVCRWSTRRR